MSFVNGWYMYDPLNLPYIYDGIGSNYTPTSDRPHYSWAFASIWRQHDAAIIFQNNTSAKIQFTKIGIQTVSCNNIINGNVTPFWSDAGQVGLAANGGQASYTFYIDKINYTGEVEMIWNGQSLGYFPTYSSSGQTSSQVSLSVDSANFNLNYPGSSVNDTAIFGEYPFTGTDALTYREFEFTDSPELLPGEYAALRLAVHSFSSDNTCIRFIMNPNDMNIEFVLEPQAKIWKMCKESDGSQRWKLVELAQIRTESGWTDIKNQK